MEWSESFSSSVPIIATSPGWSRVAVVGYLPVAAEAGCSGLSGVSQGLLRYSPPTPQAPALGANDDGEHVDETAEGIVESAGAIPE